MMSILSSKIKYLRTAVAALLCCAPRAESPTGNSVGRSPTYAVSKNFKPCKGDGKQPPPLLFAPYP